MKNYLKKIILLSLIIFSVFKIYSQTTATINTIPKGAIIFDENNNEIGTTPFNLENLDKTILKIKIVKEDYHTVEVTLKEKRKKLTSFFDMILECKGFLFKDNQNNEVVRLLKTFKEIENNVLVGIKDPIINIDENEILGKINGNKKQLKDKDIYIYLGYPQNMEIKILNSFKDSYIDAEFFNDKKSEEDISHLQKPKIIFKPIVKKIEFNLKGNLMRDYTGNCFLECEWQLFDLSDLNKPIETFVIQTTNYRTENNYELILHEMIELSGKQLLENELLYNLLINTEKKYLERSKGESLKINLSKRKIFLNTTEMVKETIRSVVTIETDGKFGSGVFISDNGYLLTNYHVIEGKKTIYVKVDNNRKIIAELIKFNKDYDLAILQVKITNSKGLSLVVESTNSNLGEDVFAIGTPLDRKLQQSVSKGIISGFREFNGVNFIQTDVNINSGNSGGPLLNVNGEIIGINTLKATGKDVSGIGFAIPTTVVVKMLNIIN